MPASPRIDRTGWSISDYTLEGLSISRESNPSENLHNNKKVDDAYEHYRLWYLSLKDFLNKNAYLNPSHPNYAGAVAIFAVSDTPLLRDWSSDFENPKSERSQQLLQAISKDTKDILAELKTFSIKTENNAKLWLTKLDDNYYFDGKPVLIKSRDAEYARIFDVVFSLLPNGGTIKYSDIAKAAPRRPKLVLTNKTIQRALTGKDANFFRYVDIPSTTPAGLPLFVAKQNGEELTFNNRK